MAAFRRLVDHLTHAFELVAEIALVVLLLLVGHEVFVRYLLNAPTQFSVEFSEYLLVLISFFAAAYVLRRDRHVRVTFVINLLPPWARAASDALGYALVSIYCGILVWYGGTMSWTALLGDDRSSSLISFPLWLPYAVIPLGGLALGLQAMLGTVDALQRLRNAAPAAEQG